MCLRSLRQAALGLAAIVYPLAPLAASRKAATKAFVRVLTSASARAVYLKHGFVVLGGT
jgi:ABC-type molybdate transport system substrate-binding protein